MKKRTNEIPEAPRYEEIHEEVQEEVQQEIPEEVHEEATRKRRRADSSREEADRMESNVPAP